MLLEPLHSARECTLFARFHLGIALRTRDLAHWFTVQKGGSTDHIAAHTKPMSTALRVRLQESGSKALEDLRSFLLLIFTVLEVNLARIEERWRFGGCKVFLRGIR